VAEVTDNSPMTGREGRRDQVLELIRQSREPLDDDEIAEAAQMNRIYVNTICRRLAQNGLIVRIPGSRGKLVNAALDRRDLTRAEEEPSNPYSPARLPRSHLREPPWLTGQIQQLTASFADCVTVFEANRAFPGPSLYFHLRAIERRRAHQAVSSLLDDRLFLEYVYAVLPAWGMHRMGRQAAKVGDFTQITTALKEKTPALEQLWPLRITALSEQAALDAAALVWEVIAYIKVSTSQTQIVAGSKFLHHVLPDLVPPIDRRYTFRFFTGRQRVQSDRAAFLDWFPRMAGIGTRCSEPIREAIDRGGYMATSAAKVIDNAIMGFMQQRQPAILDEEATA
jgi:hypothetical protein